MRDLIAACDPGAKESGLVLVEWVDGQPDVIAARVVRRNPREEPDPSYVGHVVDQMTDYADSPEIVVAVETVKKPNPHTNQAQGGPLVIIDPIHLFKTSFVIGALMFRFPDLILIEPGGNDGGVNPPRELIGSREGTALGGINRHARSAYSVALRAHRR